MDQLHSSSWSYTTGRATRPPDERLATLYVTLLESVSKIVSWCERLWRGLGHSLSNINLRESRFKNDHPSFKGVRIGQVRVMERPHRVSSLSAELMYSTPRAPPPLAERQYLEDHPSSPRMNPRRITWSEDQINRLQEENRTLRSQIISQKRVVADKNHTIGLLRQQNTKINKELSRQNEALTQLANMAVAIQGPGNLPVHDTPSDSSASLDHRTIDEVIQVYRDLLPDARDADTIQSSGSTYSYSTYGAYPQSHGL